jgi:hypothetical protein
MGEKRRELFRGGKSISLLEGPQALPARPSRNNSKRPRGRKRNGGVVRGTTIVTVDNRYFIGFKVAQAKPARPSDKHGLEK